MAPALQRAGATLQEGIQGEPFIMSNTNPAQELREYITIPNAFVHHRADGVKIALPCLRKDDPGHDGSREDAQTAKLIRDGSQNLLAALRAYRG